MVRFQRTNRRLDDKIRASRRCLGRLDRVRRVTMDDLVKRCREGDRQAQRELYDRTVERVYRLLLRLANNNRDDAFDLTQDTYVRVFTQLDRFDGRSRFETWLYRIAVNEGLQFLRDAGRRRKRARTVAREDRAESHEHEVTAKIDLDRALARLDDTDRTILLLRYQVGLDYRAIAAATDLAEGTVASRLNRARKKLRDLLGPAYGPPVGSPCKMEETAAKRHPNKGHEAVSVGTD